MRDDFDPPLWMLLLLKPIVVFEEVDALTENTDLSVFLCLQLSNVDFTEISTSLL